MQFEEMIKAEKYSMSSWSLRNRLMALHAFNVFHFVLWKRNKDRFEFSVYQKESEVTSNSIFHKCTKLQLIGLQTVLMGGCQ